LRDETIREAAAGTGDEALAAELLPLSIAFATRSASPGPISLWGWVFQKAVIPVPEFDEQTVF